MIRYLKHTEIDRQKWDDCILRSVNSLVYAQSWYLDRVSPGWEALEEGDYQSVFPLPCKRKWGIPYLAQPFFTQQLGLFSTAHLTPDLVSRFIRAIPARFRLVDIHLNSMNKVDSSVAAIEVRSNHELELLPSYADLSGHYSTNVRRNLRKALDAGVSVRRKVAPEELVNLFRNNFGAKEGKLAYRHYMMILSVIQESLATAKGIVLGAYGTGVHPDAAAFFLKDHFRYIMLLAASDFSTRQNGAMFLLLDTFIREHAGEPLILDFEGGNDPNLGRFYKSFGARETTYPFLRIRRFPFGCVNEP